MKNGKRFQAVRSLAALCVVVLVVAGAAVGGALAAERNLDLSASSQVYQAFAGRNIEKFTEETGIGVQVTVTYSEAALARLRNGMTDLAAVASRMDAYHRSLGFVEWPFAMDTFAVISNVQVTVKDLTEAQLREVFSGAVTNWSELGGPDKPLVVIIPAKNTAAYQNFSRLVMDGQDMEWDIMCATSVEVLEVIRRIPWSISFVAQSATYGKPEGAKVMDIAGKGPGSPGYPYYQTFSLVTKGAPAGDVAEFVNWVYSGTVRKAVREMGMTPLERP